MTLEQAKEFIATHTDPLQMTTAEIAKFRRALEIVAGSWAIIQD